MPDSQKGTVTFRPAAGHCVMSVALSTVAVTVKTRSGHGQVTDPPLTVCGPTMTTGLTLARISFRTHLEVLRLFKAMYLATRRVY
jgi:hypothetical protein